MARVSREWSVECVEQGVDALTLSRDGTDVNLGAVECRGGLHSVLTSLPLRSQAARLHSDFVSDRCSHTQHSIHLLLLITSATLIPATRSRIVLKQLIRDSASRSVPVSTTLPLHSHHVSRASSHTSAPRCASLRLASSAALCSPSSHHRFAVLSCRARCCSGLPSSIPPRSKSVSAQPPHPPPSARLPLLSDAIDRRSVLLSHLSPTRLLSFFFLCSVYLRAFGGEAAGASSLAPKVGPLGLSAKKVADDIAKATMSFKGLRVTVKLTVQNRVATVSRYRRTFTRSAAAASPWCASAALPATARPQPRFLVLLLLLLLRPCHASRPIRPRASSPLSAPSQLMPVVFPSPLCRSTWCRPLPP